MKIDTGQKMRGDVTRMIVFVTLIRGCLLENDLLCNRKREVKVLI